MVTSDLVEELRQRAESFSNHLYAADLHTRAAIEIERLRADLAAAAGFIARYTKGEGTERILEQIHAALDRDI